MRCGRRCIEIDANQGNQIQASEFCPHCLARSAVYSIKGIPFSSVSRFLEHFRQRSWVKWNIPSDIRLVFERLVAIVVTRSDVYMVARFSTPTSAAMTAIVHRYASSEKLYQSSQAFSSNQQRLNGTGSYSVNLASHK